MPLTFTSLLAASLLLLPLLGAAAAPEPPALPVTQARGGLPHAFAKLKAGKPVTVVYFGGSITAGAGASQPEQTSYRALVGQWLTRTFPEAAVTDVNASIGGTGSDLGAFRAGRDVLSRRPDLVFVEFAVNDGGAPDATVDRSMEGIVRQVRRADPAADLCFVYTFVTDWLPDLGAGRLHPSVQRDEIVAAHYGIPSVNVALPAARKLLAGTMTREEFSKDGVHPTDAGHRIYADTLIAFLQAQAARKEAAARPRPLPRRCGPIRWNTPA